MKIYHITDTEKWEAAQDQGTFGWSNIDEPIDEVGFMYASDSMEQARRVAEFLLADRQNRLTLLAMDRERLTKAGFDIRFEALHPKDPTSEKFPHVYGGEIPIDLIEASQPFEGQRELIEYLWMR